MKSLVKIVEIYVGTFRTDFTMRGYIQPIPGSSIEHAGCERHGALNAPYYAGLAFSAVTIAVSEPFLLPVVEIGAQSRG